MAVRLQRFDQLLKGQIEVAHRVEHPLSHIGQQRAERRVAGQGDTQRHRVDKEANQRLDFLAFAVGCR